MMSRIAAVGLGLGAGLAAVIFLSVNWDQAAAWIGLGNAGAGINPEARLAWTVAGGVAAFAAVALIGALIGGLVEAFLAHSRIAALRYDLTLIDTWTAADWRAAFAETAVADAYFSRHPAFPQPHGYPLGETVRCPSSPAIPR